MENLFEYLISKKNKKNITNVTIKDISDKVIDEIIKYWGKYITFSDELKKKHILRCTAPTGRWDTIYLRGFPREVLKFFDDITIDLKNHTEFREVLIDDLVEYFFKNNIYDYEIIADQINNWIDKSMYI